MLAHWQIVLLDLLQSSLVAAVAVPAILTYVLGAVKAASRRKGPFPLTFFLRPSNIPYADRALGIDLLFAAAGSQFTFLAAYASNLAPRTLHKGIASEVLHELGITSQDKVVLAFDFLPGILVALLIISAATRVFGYIDVDGDYELREEFATGPNILGFLSLMVVWGVNGT